MTKKLDVQDPFVRKVEEGKVRYRFADVVRRSYEKEGRSLSKLEEDGINKKFVEAALDVKNEPTGEIGGDKGNE